MDDIFFINELPVGMVFLTVGDFSRAKGWLRGFKMVKKQRLALAISSALSLLVGTGCSTTAAIKASAAGDSSSEVTVHHISYQKYSLKLQQHKPSPEILFTKC